MNDPLKPFLTFDALDVAEKLSGGEENIGLGLALLHANAAIKNKLLKERGDTILNNKLDEYITIIESIGFEKVLEQPFLYKASYSPQERNETTFIYAKRNGLVLFFTTYNTVNVNGGHLYYNWKPHLNVSGADVWDCVSSGSYAVNTEEKIWVGHHDCREALVYNIDRLEANGTFLETWFQRPFLWFLNYADEHLRKSEVTSEQMQTNTAYYDIITRERIALLPEWVQKMIGPEK